MEASAPVRWKVFVSLLAWGLAAYPLTAQQVATDSLQPETQQADTLPKRKKLDILPAISFAPETGLTLGVIGFYYLDIAPKDPTNRRSFVNFLAVYTTKQQLLIESTYDLFSARNEYRFRGRLQYNIFPDRNYGLGNEANFEVVELDAENIVQDTLNHLRFSVDRIGLQPVFLKRISQHFYAGLQFDVEYQYNFSITPDAVRYPSPADSIGLNRTAITGLYAGAGINLLYDRRDNIINPLKGTLIEFSNHFFGKWLGSDFTFSNFRLDARQYINPVSNHTLALRGLLNFRFADRTDGIPMRRLSRVGGHDNFRGYFRGTFQDNHLLGLAAEYRLPFWPEQTDAKGWEIWRRLGIVGFVHGTQVFGDGGDFAFNQFNLAAGTGLRVLFNKRTRLNVRIDFAVGLTPDAAGQGKRQTGLYFYLGEAF